MGKPLSALRVGMIGAGAIATQYIETFPRLTHVRLHAIADLDAERARAAATEASVTCGPVQALSVAELLASPEVDIVLNLTIPRAHAQVAEAALAAGKHVYGEKPLTATVAEGKRVIAAAEHAGLRVACAPDTVLGSGVQTARAAIDAGLIGTPISATATMVTPGHERWHPQPDFYYQPGGGPLLDMGPYYITTLVSLLGPVERVIGAASRTRSERVIGTGVRAGQSIPVTTDSHVTGVLVHSGGALSTLVMSFDAAATRSANIEIHGDRASLVVPDPNRFDGTPLLHPVGEQWSELPINAGFVDAGRGCGLDELAAAIQEGRPHRASAELALHVLEVMEALLDSAHRGVSIAVDSRPPIPASVPLT